MRKLLVSSLVVISAISTIPARAGNVGEIIAGVAVGAIVMHEIDSANRRSVPAPMPEIEIRAPRGNGGYATRGYDRDYDRGQVYSTIGGRNYVAPVMVNGIVYEGPACDEQYYDGQYNPGAARSFCQGVRVRYARDLQRQQQEAYNRGANGY